MGGGAQGVFAGTPAVQPLPRPHSDRVAASPERQQLKRNAVSGSRWQRQPGCRKHGAAAGKALWQQSSVAAAAAAAAAAVISIRAAAATGSSTSMVAAAACLAAT